MHAPAGHASQGSDGRIYQCCTQNRTTVARQPGPRCKGSTDAVEGSRRADYSQLKRSWRRSIRAFIGNNWRRINVICCRWCSRGIVR